MDDETARAFTQSCGMHLLALSIIGNTLRLMCRDGTCTPQDVLSDLEQHRDKILKNRGNQIGWKTTTITSCLAFSYDTLEDVEKTTAQGLSAFPTEKDIPLGAIQYLAGCKDRSQARIVATGLLKKCILLRFDANTASVHSLMHEFLSTKRDQNVDLTKPIAYFTAYHFVKENGEHDSLQKATKDQEWLRDEEEIVLAAIKTNAAALRFCSKRLQTEPICVRAAMESFGYDRLSGMLQFGDKVTEIANKFLAQDVQMNESQLGKEHPDTLSSVNNLAALLQNRGDYDNAEPLYRRALEARERTLGKEHPDTLSSVNNLAALLRGRGDYDNAEPLYRRALEARERTLGRSILIR